MEPLTFCDLVQWNQSISNFANVGTTRFKLIAPALAMCINAPAQSNDCINKVRQLQYLSKKLVFCLFMKQSKGCSRGHKLSLKCCYDHKLLNPSKGKLGLSKEVVYDLIDQRATKLQSLKVCSVRDSNPGRSESNDSLHKIALKCKLWDFCDFFV